MNNRQNERDGWEALKEYKIRLDRYSSGENIDIDRGDLKELIEGATDHIEREVSSIYLTAWSEHHDALREFYGNSSRVEDEDWSESQDEDEHRLREQIRLLKDILLSSLNCIKGEKE